MEIERESGREGERGRTEEPITANAARKRTKNDIINGMETIEICAC